MGKKRRLRRKPEKSAVKSTDSLIGTRVGKEIRKPPIVKSRFKRKKKSGRKQKTL